MPWISCDHFKYTSSDIRRAAFQLRIRTWEDVCAGQSKTAPIDHHARSRQVAIDENFKTGLRDSVVDQFSAACMSIKSCDNY